MSASVQQQQRQIDALGPWFHNLHLPGGLQTVPDHFIGGDFPRFKWEQVKGAIPEDLSGWRVLDVGCNAGFYSFELARRGASVLAVDIDPHYLAQARWAAQEFGLQDRVEFRQLQVYDLARDNEQFDLVWFMGVFYHLRYPLLALDILAQRTRRMMMFQTLALPGKEVYPDTADHPITERQPLLDPGWPKMAFIEHRFSGDPTNWWVPNHAGIEAMLRSSGLQVTGHPADEIYLCVPNPATAAWQWDTQYASVVGNRADTPQQQREEAGAA
ncbi:MAG: 3-demethylubiquinone-9 3-methyltransferase [Ramlibacter sp.]|uniref:TIGR04290 family methyltransferase n=1 Tax=Ramlibacter sp. TaxID=1917967 RepID=UPI0026083E98|nr:TIGR04290 family methyltransferase [Ramlibacter sp.]MDB5750367.1 3-demethylubiquinone-9 3-methyltransferase [Ramlibacter sp.]